MNIRRVDGVVELVVGGLAATRVED